jgi:hypothetical protein
VKQVKDLTKWKEVYLTVTGKISRDSSPEFNYYVEIAQHYNKVCPIFSVRLLYEYQRTEISTCQGKLTSTSIHL